MRQIKLEIIRGQYVQRKCAVGIRQRWNLEHFQIMGGHFVQLQSRHRDKGLDLLTLNVWLDTIRH